LVQGKAKARVARQYGVSEDSLSHHEKNHLSHQLRTAYEKRAAIEGLDMLAEIEELIRRTKRILDTAETEGKLNTALHAIGQARGSYELLSKIAFSLHQARLAELELEREKAGANEKAATVEYQESLSILDDWELELFEQLIDKIHSGDEKMHIQMPAPKTVWPKPKPILPEPDDEDEDMEDIPPEPKKKKPGLRRKKPPQDNHKVRVIEPSPIPYTPRKKRRR
jgi:hypothetical protein